MRLPKPFYKLPLQLDVARLQSEVRAMPPSAWVAHPTAIPGNSAIRLISATGGENDAVFGSMLPTEHLQQSPYIRQVLASFGVVWSRSRLMRLAPGAVVPEHADINYHWYQRVRLHFPIITHPSVSFRCGEQTVHMAAGEVWLFDNWRLHSVDNPTDQERIHLVADTSGTAAFWQRVGLSERPTPMQALPFQPQLQAQPLTENQPAPLVMPPAEVQLLAQDIQGELMAVDDRADTLARLGHYRMALEGFVRDWRQTYLLYGDGQPGWTSFMRLRDALREASRQLGDGLLMRTNRVGVHQVVQGRLVQHVLHLPDQPSAQHGTRRHAAARLTEPVFIVAAPRSGSTLLFETLAVTPQLCNLGGEAHWLVESIADLQPGNGRLDSNRLTEAHCTAAISERIIDMTLQHLQRADGTAVNPAATNLRLLEKTPKNSLRIPFFNRIFPDARFVFLWRDPHANISSIMEAWRSGDWITYRGLKDWPGPWSLLLPPGWQSLRGRPLQEIAAYQWEVSNRMVLDDLAQLDRSRWMSVSYADLLGNAPDTVDRICAFAGLRMDAPLQQRVSAPLPLSRYTQTPPTADKWRRNAAVIESVIPSVQATWQRLQALR